MAEQIRNLMPAPGKKKHNFLCIFSNFGEKIAWRKLKMALQSI